MIAVAGSDVALRLRAGIITPRSLVRASHALQQLVTDRKYAPVARCIFNAPLNMAVLYEHLSPRRRSLVPFFLRTCGDIHQAHKQDRLLSSGVAQCVARWTHNPKVRGSHRICRALSICFAQSSDFASKSCASCLRRTLRINAEPSSAAAGVAQRLGIGALIQRSPCQALQQLTASPTTQPGFAARCKFRRRGESAGQKADVSVFAKLIIWIPFGDHPLKLERYRED